MTYEKLKMILDDYGEFNVNRVIDNCVITSLSDVNDVVIHRLASHRHQIKFLYFSDTFDTEQYILEDFR